MSSVKCYSPINPRRIGTGGTGLIEEGNPVFFKIKDFWIPTFVSMTIIVIPSMLLQDALKYTFMV